MTDKQLLKETNNYRLEVAETQIEGDVFPVDRYVIVNKNTGVVEFMSSLYFYAHGSLAELQEKHELADSEDTGALMGDTSILTSTH